MSKSRSGCVLPRGQGGPCSAVSNSCMLLLLPLFPGCQFLPGNYRLEPRLALGGLALYHTVPDWHWRELAPGRQEKQHQQEENLDQR